MQNQESIKLITLGLIYVLLFVSEQLRPYFKNRQQHTLHSARNILLALFNACISTIFLIFAIKHICDWTYVNNIGILNQLNLSSGITLFTALVLIDCWQYIWHRINHIVPILWKFHRLHHSDKEMDASTGLRFHPIEIIYSHTIRLAIIPITGIQLEHLLAYELILLPVILFHHSNITLNETIDRVLRILIVTPHMHRLHHSDKQKETDSNYSSIFSFWDRLFQTFSMRPIISNFNLGLGNEFSEGEWNRLKGMLVIPFSKK